ncbi:MAG: acetate--CoA ligase family protein [Dysgonamonadaceae bacterium]|jgi:acetyltransferase|nr:acetate--CoA ligase family protein [Dysgonamonadaceae bacterium]
MINQELINPKSIVVVGGSNKTSKPGGNCLRNLLNGKYKGKLYAVNAKETEVQGVKCYQDVREIPPTEMAIISIPARACPETIKILAEEKGVKAFIMFTAGFGEETAEGAQLEKEIVEIVNRNGASLIGPNCIGILNRYHHSLFTLPIPEYDPMGVDMISSSGGTCLFIMESSIRMGLRFNTVWSVGNAAQIGVEEILEYMDENFNPETDSKIKLLYIESIRDPDKLMEHTSSLIRKGCRIAAIKSGSSESGMRAASSHTGAMANPDLAVEALFRKAGIVRCNSREELATVGAIFTLKELKGKNLAIVTHAGGPAVILTDALARGGMEIPKLSGTTWADKLKKQLLPGSAISNPIDILGTGGPDHLALAIDYCEHKFQNIDGIAVIFGSPGLTRVYEAYEVLAQKMKTCSKPIFPILPSVSTAWDETDFFIKQGYVNFSDEVGLADALTKVLKTPRPLPNNLELKGVDIPLIRRIIDNVPESGYIAPKSVQNLLRAAGIPMVEEIASPAWEEIRDFAEKVGFPVVAKVVGPVHKSDVGGVVLNIRSVEHLEFEYNRLMEIEGAEAVLVQPMLKGFELFAGAKYEEKFGHIVLCGLGGIFVEIFKDVASGLAPLATEEALSMIRSLKGYKVFRGARGQKSIDEHQFAKIIVQLSALLRFASEIKELDINPLLATDKGIIAVDARIRIEKAPQEIN